MSPNEHKIKTKTSAQEQWDIYMNIALIVNSTSGYTPHLLENSLKKPSYGLVKFGDSTESKKCKKWKIINENWIKNWIENLIIFLIMLWLKNK